MKSLISMLVFTLVLSVLPPAQAGPSERDRCDRAKDAAAAKHFGCRARIERTHLLDARSERKERKIAKCDAALRTSFYNRENATPPFMGSDDSEQCSHYDDVENIIALNEAVATALEDGSASVGGAAATCVGRSPELNRYLPITESDCGKVVKHVESGHYYYCSADDECLENEDCCHGYFAYCDAAHRCDGAVDEDCGSAGLDETHDGGVFPLPYGWTYFGEVRGDIDGEEKYVTCRDGSKSGYAISLGSFEDAHNVLIRIEGGGACFNEHSCILSPFQYTWFWFADALIESPKVMHILPIRPGVFDRKNSDNPFKHWTHVYIPHCSGDVGIGKNEGVTFHGLERPFPLKPELITNTFQGWDNFEIIAKDMINRFKNSWPRPLGDRLRVRRYILSGDSAGGYGAMGNYKHFKQLVMDHSELSAEGKLPVIDVLDDSGAPLATRTDGLTGCLQKRMWDSWGLKDTIGAGGNCEYCREHDFLLPMATDAIKTVAQSGRYAGFENSQYDSVLSGFFGFGRTACTNDGVGVDGVSMRGRACQASDPSECDTRPGAGDGRCTPCWQLDDPAFQGPLKKHANLTPNQYQNALRIGLNRMWTTAEAHGHTAQPNFRYFILAGGDHASNQLKAFYERESNGVRLVDWVGDLVGDGYTPSESWANVWPNPIEPPDVPACGAGEFDNLEGCEACAGLQPPCDDCSCPDFDSQLEANCLAACGSGG